MTLSLVSGAPPVQVPSPVQFVPVLKSVAVFFHVTSAACEGRAAVTRIAKIPAAKMNLEEGLDSRREGREKAVFVFIGVVSGRGFCGMLQ